MHSSTLCSAEILAGSVDGAVRRFDVRMGRLFTDELHHPVTCVKGGQGMLCCKAGRAVASLHAIQCPFPRVDGLLPFSSPRRACYR